MSKPGHTCFCLTRGNKNGFCLCFLDSKHWPREMSPKSELIKLSWRTVQFSSVAQLYPTLCDPMNHSTPGLPPSPTPRVHPNPSPLSQGCHPTVSSSVVPFSSCPQSFLSSASFPMSQLFTSGGQSIGVSASIPVLPMNTQD